MKRVLSLVLSIVLILTSVMILPVSAAADTKIAMIHDGTSALNAKGANISQWLASAAAEFSATGGHRDGTAIKYTASEFARIRVYDSEDLSNWNGAEYLQFYINASGSTVTHMQMYIKEDSGAYDGFQSYGFSEFAEGYLSTNGTDWSKSAEFIGEDMITAGSPAGTYGHLVIPANFKGYFRIPLDENSIENSGLWGWNNGADYSTAFAAKNLEFQFHFLGQTTLYFDDVALVGSGLTEANTGSVVTESEYMSASAEEEIKYAEMNGFEVPVRTALDFENGEAASIHSGINQLGLTFEQSSAYKSSGNYSLKVTAPANGGYDICLSQIQPQVINTGDISGAKYFEFWVKNTSNTVYTINWAKINGIEYSPLSTEISRYDGEAWEILKNYEIPAGYEGKFRVKVGANFVNVGSNLSSFEFALQDTTKSGGVLYFDDFKFINLMTVGEKVTMPEGLDVLSVFHDFEDGVADIKSGINFVPVDFSSSENFAESGKSLAITVANRSGSNPALSQVQPAWTGADISKAQYIQFWVKNASEVDFGMTWLEFGTSFNHSNTEISMLYDGNWYKVEAYKQLEDAFKIPAGYEGFIRIKVGGENGITVDDNFINTISMAVRDDNRTAGAVLYLDSFSVVGVSTEKTPEIRDDLKATFTNIGIGSIAGLDKTAIGGGVTTAAVKNDVITATSTAQGFGVTFEVTANLAGKEFIEFDLFTNNEKLFNCDKNNGYFRLYNTVSNSSVVYDFGDVLIKGLNHIRIPLAKFTGIDLSNITNIEISLVPVNSADAPNAIVEISNLRAASYANGGNNTILNIDGEFAKGIKEGTTYKYVSDLVGDKLGLMANNISDAIATGDKFTVGNKALIAAVAGDVNGDGGVTSSDLIKFKKVLFDVDALSAAQEKAVSNLNILGLINLKKMLLDKTPYGADVYSVGKDSNKAFGQDVVAATWVTVWNANSEPWYDFSSTNGTTINVNGTDRAINWNEPAQVEQMLSEIKAAGIDLVIFDLTNGFHDYVTPRVTRAARICRELGLKIACATGIGTGIDTVIGNAEIAWNLYAKPDSEFSDIYFNYKGKPVLIDYMTRSYFDEAVNSSNEYLSKFTHQFAAGHQHYADKWGWQVDPSTGTIPSSDVVFVTPCVYNDPDYAETWATSMAMLDNNMMVAKSAGASIVVVGCYDDTWERNMWGKFDTTNSVVAERKMKNIFGDVSVLGYYNRVTEWLNDGPSYIKGGLLKDGVYKLSNNGKYIAVSGTQTRNNEAIITTATENNLNTCVYIYHLGNNEYRIVRLTGAKSLAIDGSSVVQNYDENVDTQKWIVSQGNNGQFIFTNKANNKVLTAGNTVTTSSYSGAASQQWTVSALTTIG